MDVDVVVGVSADGMVGTGVGVVMGVVVSLVATVVELEGSLMPPPASAGWVVTAKSPIMAPITAILFDDCMIQSFSQVNTGG